MLRQDARYEDLSCVANLPDVVGVLKRVFRAVGLVGFATPEGAVSLGDTLLTKDNMTMTQRVQPTQEQMYYQASRKVGELNQEFMWLAQNGMTREDLQRNIERRPSLWSRFSGFLATLPSRNAAATSAS